MSLYIDMKMEAPQHRILATLSYGINSATASPRLRGEPDASSSTQNAASPVFHWTWSVFRQKSVVQALPPLQAPSRHALGHKFLAHVLQNIWRQTLNIERRAVTAVARQRSKTCLRPRANQSKSDPPKNYQNLREVRPEVKLKHVRMQRTRARRVFGDPSLLFSVMFVQLSRKIIMILLPHLERSYRKPRGAYDTLNCQYSIFTTHNPFGFTMVKNTACLPVLRLTPPGIKPMVHYWPQFFPVSDVLKKNSVKPSGNNTLSCKARLIVLPECPSIARRYKNWWR